MPIPIRPNPMTQEWRDAADSVIKEIATHNQYVVSDMVVTALELAGLGLDNYSSLGGVFKRAATNGYVQKTSETQQSTRSRSKSAKTIWISTIYKEHPMSNEARALSNLLISALNFNTETVRYATIIFRAQGLDAQTTSKALSDFQKMQDVYQSQVAKVLEDFQKRESNNSK